jgi:hypothetical protein
MINQSMTTRLGIAAFVLAALTAAPVHATEFALGEGSWVGVWKTTLTQGLGVRNGTPQAQLVGAGAGQSYAPGAWPGSPGGIALEFPGAHGGVGVNDDAQLNFKQYDVFSAPLALSSELSLRHRTGQGLFLRVRAWYDLALESQNTRHGNSPGGYLTSMGSDGIDRNIHLSDDGFLGAAKFKGIDIYDIFYFANLDLGRSRLALRVGRQAIDWGEGIFYQGISAINPIDAAWATTTGARVANGGKLPVNRVYANLDLPAGFSLDGFVNLEFRSTVVPGCGTYYSMLDNGLHPGCNLISGAGLPDATARDIKTKNYYNGKLYAGGYFPDGGPDANATHAPSSWSGYGAALHKFVEPLQTEFGIYFASYTSPTPIQAPVVGPDGTAMTFAVNNMFVEDVKSIALSAATGFRNLAVSGQVTVTLDYPTQRNAPAFIEGSTQGIGVYSYMQTQFAGREAPGYYRLDVVQLQGGGTWQLGRLIGLSDVTLTGEGVLVWNTNQPSVDGPNAERLGRGGNFGLASWNQEGYVCDPGPLSNGIVNKCATDGFVTPFAAGYKLRMATVFNPAPGLAITPALTFSHDVTGFSADGSVVGGRRTYGAFLRTDMFQEYFVELGGFWYRRDTEYDPARDRGQYTIAVGYNLR